MNIYSNEFTQEFKDNLPIKWDIWANRDLSNIPTKYHDCFTTDWNWGQYSSMRWEERDRVQSLWLEYNNEWIIKNKKITEPCVSNDLIDDFEGFDDDEDYKNGFVRF